MKKFLFPILAAAWFFIPACQKDSDNPYDDIVRPDTTTQTNQPYDTASIAGLHRFILKDKCAIPSCHGGLFEPDFRTPQSSYTTLVYAPVVKNTDDYRFYYRVIPFDTTNSWFHERLVTDDAVLGRMPRYAPPLNAKEMYYINKWILSGAKDLDGKVPVRPNLNARIYGYLAGYLDGSTLHRVDSLRTEYASPFPAPADTELILGFYTYDDETPQKNFHGNILKLSTDPNDFSSATEVKAEFDPNLYIWLAHFNTAQFDPGETVYMRYYLRDTDHAEMTEQPNANTRWYTIKYYSFKVE